MGTQHDSNYRQLFSHPEMVGDLLSSFLPYPWAQQLDIGVFERINASYVSERGQQRHQDMVWKVQLGGQALYLYLLLEFQSRNEHWMALRMQVYVGLLCQDLIKRGQLGSDGKLPPVLPIVLYHGAARWSASTDLRALVQAAPEGLRHLQPAQKYLLIDQHRQTDAPGIEEKNLLAALFRLEHWRSEKDLSELIARVIAWLDQPRYEALRTTATHWLTQRLHVQINETTIPESADILEVQSMTTEKLEMLRRQFSAEGMQEGLQKGREGADRDRLCALLQMRFGPLPPEQVLRIREAPLERIERWFERLFDAGSLDQLLGSQ